ncbi:MAG: hypothetical protein FWC59_03530 [Actinomycetia bacterium]|nr:hypothetical protein [Actinomycetes bacterium]
MAIKPQSVAGEPIITTQPSWARRQAFQILRKISSQQAFARPLIQKALRVAPAPPAERDFAERLVLGVTATWGELDLIIQRSLAKRQADPIVQDILRLATYELVFLAKADYAAVDQAVALTHQQRPAASGFVNWALRRIALDLRDFPWGDPQNDLTALAHSQAFPLWLAERLVQEQGWSAASQFMAVANQPAPIFVQDLTTGTALEWSAGQLAESETELSSGQRWIIADLATQQVARRVANVIAAFHPSLDSSASEEVAAQTAESPLATPGFLEVGSGRGTKTVLINRQLQRQGLVYRHLALDDLEFKTTLLGRRIAQYQLTGVQAQSLDIRQLSGLADFVVAFLDAPCSGSGTLRRHPEIRWRLQPEDLDSLVAQSLELLQALSVYLAPGGRLIYATCSVLQVENEGLVRAFLATPAGQGFQLLDWPGESSPWFYTHQQSGGGDAHFAALLQRPEC